MASEDEQNKDEHRLARERERPLLGQHGACASERVGSQPDGHGTGYNSREQAPCLLGQAGKPVVHLVRLMLLW